MTALVEDDRHLGRRLLAEEARDQVELALEGAVRHEEHARARRAAQVAHVVHAGAQLCVAHVALDVDQRRRDADVHGACRPVELEGIEEDATRRATFAASGAVAVDEGATFEVRLARERHRVQLHGREHAGANVWAQKRVELGVGQRLGRGELGRFRPPHRGGMLRAFGEGEVAVHGARRVSSSLALEIAQPELSSGRASAFDGSVLIRIARWGTLHLDGG